MEKRLKITALLLASLLGNGLMPWQLSATADQSLRVAQATATTVTGELSEQSDRLNDGSFFERHPFEGEAGQVIRIDLTSEDFDPYLIVIGPDGNDIAQDDDGGNGTDARLTLTLPTTGTYQILANTYRPGATGSYILSWETVTGEAALQAETLQRAEALNQQVLQLYQAGRYGEAIPIAEEALRIRRDLLPENHPDVAQSLHNLAETYRNQGRYREAEPLFQEALRIRRAVFGDSHVAVASVLSNFGLLYIDQGRHQEAEPLFQEALTIRRNVLGEDHRDTANSLHNLAGLYQEQGRYREAETLYGQALAILRNVLGPSHPAVATTLQTLGGLYQQQCRYEEAQSTLLESLRIRRDQLREGHPSVANSLNALARLYQEQGRYGEAAPLYEEALRISRAAFGEENPAVAAIFNNLALLYRAQGDYEAAEPLYQQAIEIYQNSGATSELATSFNNLALLYRIQGEYEAAEPLYQQAIEIYQGIFGDLHPDVASSLNNLAHLYTVQARYQEAESLHLQALEIRQNLHADLHPDVAQSLNNLAYLYAIQGRYQEAEPLYKQALTIRQETQGEYHPNVADSFNNLAGLYWAQDDIPNAIDYLARGLEVEEANLSLNLASLNDAQRQTYAATITASQDWAIALHLQSAPDNHRVAELALLTLLRRKGRLLDVSVNSLQTLRQNLTPADRQVLDAFTAARQQLATLSFNPPSALVPAQYREELTRLETEANRLETELARRSTVFQAELQPIALDTVQAQIPRHTVLVEYVRYYPDHPRKAQNPIGVDRYAAYLLFPDGRMTAVDLGQADEIDAAVLTLAAGLEDSGQQIGVIHQRARTLHDLVMAPLRHHLDDQTHLLISPDSLLNQIPFEALRSEQGRYLITDFEISYLNQGKRKKKEPIMCWGAPR
jgi:tetratricopeptide (TPR) repeat protein